MHNDDIVRQPIDPDAAVILDNPEMVLPTVTEQTFPRAARSHVRTSRAGPGEGAGRCPRPAVGGPHHRRPPWAD